MARRPIHVLELRSVRGTGGGPEKTIMLGAAQADRRDFAVTVCYIRDRRDRIFRLDEKAATLGIDYVEVHEQHSLDASIWPALRRLVRERQIDIVHAHEYKTDLLAWSLAQCETVVPLATVHGWTGHSRKERMVYYPLDRALLARFPRLLAVSGQIKDQLVRSGARAERVTVVLNAIDPHQHVRKPEVVAAARQSFGWGPQQLVIGAVGRLEPQKRFDLLIDAVALLQRRRSWNVRLAIAGDGSQATILNARASAALAPGTWIPLGHVGDVRAIYHAVDVFVQSSEYEGTANAVLEAMAYETPIVATDVGGTAELARDRVDAVIVAPGNAEALAAAIESIVLDPDGARRRSLAARRRVEGELSFAARMRTVEQVYRELLAATSPRAELAAAR